MFSKIWTETSTRSFSEEIEQLREELQDGDAVLVGAGSGLSTSAGFTYSGARFQKYFSDFEEAYGFHDMYAGGFYPYETLEEYWAYWSRYIWINRYMEAPKTVYQDLWMHVREKDYFVLTTNVDHQFQKAGFDRQRLFYTQGDFGLFQCSLPCHSETYANEGVLREMLLSQGYRIALDGALLLPEGTAPARKIPTELVPHCPHCGRPMTMNLRCDDTFVEDAGWHRAAERYQDFLRRHRGLRLLFLELGTGMNTPGIIKYPFWQLTAQNPKADLCLPESGRGLCAEGDTEAGHLHRWRHWRDPDKAVRRNRYH